MMLSSYHHPMISYDILCFDEAMLPIDTERLHSALQNQGLGSWCRLGFAHRQAHCTGVETQSAKSLGGFVRWIVVGVTVADWSESGNLLPAVKQNGFERICHDFVTFF